VDILLAVEPVLFGQALQEQADQAEAVMVVLMPLQVLPVLLTQAAVAVAEAEAVITLEALVLLEQSSLIGQVL
tara:strand:+ start:471 stop:689 length:219 start_codon:yes stop_codon:yes gene_type:complete